jgi:hypothetical protein
MKLIITTQRVSREGKSRMNHLGAKPGGTMMQAE